MTALVRRLTLIVGLLAALWIRDAAAANEPFRHALIMGVAVYRDEEVPPLFGVPNDMDSAREIALAMGIPAGNITELFNEKATKTGIVAELERLARRSTDGGRILIYFSGHGTRWRDSTANGCVEGLLTWDRQVIVNREFAQLTRPLGLKADKLIIMFDACHSGGVAGLRRNTRSMGPSIANDSLSPKFFMRADAEGNACNKPSNVRTRSLIGSAGDGVEPLPENVVHIMSARPDEVSFDEPSRGGLATQAIKGCLLGKAKDSDGSGAVSLAEVEQCAQGFIREKVARFPDLLPHHVTVSGLRNLVPVPVPVAAKPPVAVQPPAATQPSAAVQPPTAETTETTSAEAVRLEKERLVREQRAATEAQRREDERLAAQRVEQIAREQARLEAERTELARLQKEQAARERLRLEQERLAALAREAEAQRLAAQAEAQRVAAQAAATQSAAAQAAQPAVGPLASLNELHAQRDRRRSVKVDLPQTALRIGQDPFRMTVTSSHPGYVYVLLLGSDETSFYLLFPNGLDGSNRIEANVPMKLPRPHWRVNAAGPAGTDQLLVMVTETPRRMEILQGGRSSAENPFVFTPATLEGRQRLIDFMIGAGVDGSARFGSHRTEIKEIAPMSQAGERR